MSAKDQDTGAASIPPSRFYGPPSANTHLHKPTRDEQKYRSHLLSTIRSNPLLILRDFATQEQALDFIDTHGPHHSFHLFSYEKDKNGRRRYLAATYQGFWRRYRRWLLRGGPLHCYEVIREGMPVKLYFDLEFMKDVNEGLDGEFMVGRVVGMVEEMIERDVGRFVELDSTTGKKFSRHLIFEDVGFSDYGMCGGFVEELVERLRVEEPECVMVRKKGGVEEEFTTFVDLAVYSRNRCFRLVGSSKFGKDTRLLPKGLDDGKSKRVGVSDQVFFRSLVCNVAETTRLFDRSPKQTLSPSRPKLSSSQSTLGVTEANPSRYPGIDEYIRSTITPDGGRIYRSTYFPAVQILVYTIAGSYKYCANIGRHHRSNNVMFCVDLVKKHVYQRCHDPECRNFRSEPWPLPMGLLQDGEDIFDGVGDEELASILEEHDNCISTSQGGNHSQNSNFVCNKLLNAVFDESEGDHRSTGCSDDIPDEVLVRHLEEYERRHAKTEKDGEGGERRRGWDGSQAIGVIYVPENDPLMQIDLGKV